MCYIAAAIMSISAITACGSLGSIVSGASNAGAVAGKALKAILDKYINLGNLGSILGGMGTLDLTDSETVANLTKIASSIQGLSTNTSSDYLAKFAQGLISGSGKAITQEAATTITNSLAELAKRQSMTTSLTNDGSLSQAALQSTAYTVANALRQMQ